MRTAVIALSAALLNATACQPAGFTHFDTARAGQLSGSGDRETVRTALGPPHHMIKVGHHDKQCVERWTYTNIHQGWTSFDKQVFVVDFDARGVICDHGLMNSVCDSQFLANCDASFNSKRP